MQIPSGQTGFPGAAGITRQPPFFASLRQNGWMPEFHRETSPGRAAGAINRPHEDYPRRVDATRGAILSALEDLRQEPRITLDIIRRIHRQVFPDLGPAAGEWRTLDVRVRDHLAPGRISWTG